MTASVDIEQVGQILHNLIGNASKFSPAGSPIEVSVATDIEWIDITVADEGDGIAVDELGLVFRKYGRANDSVAGTGIGLFLARHIARHHGGDILYRRRPDRAGSVLILRLPRTAETVPPQIT